MQKFRMNKTPKSKAETDLGNAPSVEIIENRLSDGSKTYDVRFVRDGEACLIPMRNMGSAIDLHKEISFQIRNGNIV